MYEQVLEILAGVFSEGSGRGFCKRIISVAKAASVLGLSFSEAFDKQSIEVLQLLSLKAQDSFEEAKLLVQTHSMSAASIAQVLAESFLKVSQIKCFYVYGFTQDCLDASLFVLNLDVFYSVDTV